MRCQGQAVAMPRSTMPVQCAAMAENRAHACPGGSAVMVGGNGLLPLRLQFITIYNNLHIVYVLFFI